MCTRAYRPPEVILGNPNYNEAVDLWGAGCILAEMLTALYVGKMAELPENRVLFKASSCLPMSPDEGVDDGCEDLLQEILQTLGQQSSGDLAFLIEGKEYVYKLMEKSPESKIDFRSEFKNTRPKLCAILENLL